MKSPHYRIIWKKPINVYMGRSPKRFWSSFEVDPNHAALIRKGMPKTRKPRTTVFEFWKGRDGQFYCHLRSGREILFPSEGYKRMRSIHRLFEILTTRTAVNTVWKELRK